jgi:PAS domain S-box-containing protein
MKGQSEPVLSVTNDCLTGGGEMGALMRSMDWSKTSIGAVESWSPALRMVVRLLLANRFPLLLRWGPCYCQLYNDPYRPMLGDKHPASLGQPASECFPEIWDVIRPLIDTPFNGGSATWMDDLQLEYIRYDRLEEAHFTVAYSPVPDETVPSGIGGVLATVHEITEQVVGGRRGLALRDLGSRCGEAKTAEEACVIAARTLAEHPEDVPFALLYLLDGDQRQAHLAGAAGIEMGKAGSPLEIALSGEPSREAIWPLAETVCSAAMQIVEDLPGKLSSVPPGPWSDPPRSAAVWPIRSNMAHQFAGFLVLGLSSRLQFDDRYRDFCELVTSQVATAIANARAFEEERKRAEALAEIDRVKTAFFNNLSHEFRTPLTLMLGPLEDEMRENSKGRERLEIVHRNSLRLLKLVNTLLDFARIEAGRIEVVYEPTDLAAATAELASVFRSAIEKAGLRLVVDCPPLPEEVYVDREMWEKIVLNLLSNAFKFTFEGEIKVSLCLHGERVELSVSDTGAGIPAAELSHIFERFHRVRGTDSRTHEGTGIGLSLVQELAKIHGGGVQVRSVEGQGATFTVTIPSGHAHLPKERLGGTRSLNSTSLGAMPFVEEALRWLPGDTSSSASHFSGELGLTISSMTSQGRPQSARILFAEDNSDMRDYIRRLLAERYEVETVADGQAALERILANPPDLVLADVMMPRLDGFGLVHRLRADERTRTLPLIMLSARAGEEARVEGLNAGADDYLVKPFSARELLARVGTHLEMARLRRAAATALLESEKRFRELADNAPVMIWITDDRGNIEFANKTYLEYFQVVPAEVAGQKWKDLIHPDDYESYIQNFIAASAAGQPFHAEGRVRRRDDEWRWVDSWAVPRSTESGRVPGMVGCSADITERKRAEERIRELVAIVESSDDAILGTTLDGIITSWNKGAEKIYGYAENEVIGQPISILVPTDRRHEIPQILGGLALGEAISSYETVRRRKDGKEIHVSLTICPIRNCQDRIVGASSVARDITERKRLEEEILAVSEREQRRIGQDLHDDLCQRLAGIQLMGDVLQRDLLAKTKPEAEQASLIAARIRDAITNTKNIARGLSPVALESDGLVVALQELAENSAKLFQIICEFRFDGCVGVDDNTVAMHLYRIAQEAVTNAVKHGGAKKIVICLAESEDKCILTITDDGLGLPEPYTKNQGTGLQIMKYRAATIGASLEIGRAGRRGMCVSCCFSKQPGSKDS